MQYEKTTKLTIKESKATSISSPQHGSNLAAIGFNLMFVAYRQPLLAVEIMKLYDTAQKVQESDPEAADEDAKYALDELKKLMRSSFL